MLLPTLAFGCYLMGSAAAGILIVLGFRVYGLAAGSSAPSVLAAACAVGLGMSIGVVLGERQAARMWRPLGVAGVALAAAGTAAVLSGMIHRLARGGYLLLTPVLGGSEIGLWGLRLLFGLTILALPAALFCAAPAAFGRALSPRPPDAVALNAGFSIGLTLAGLGLGLLASPVLIFDLGVRGTLLMAVALAGFGGAGLVLLSSRGLEGYGAVGRLVLPDAAAGESADGEERPPEFTAAAGEPRAAGRIIPVVAAVLFGFSAWGYFVVWERTLGLIAGGALPARAIAGGVFVGAVAAGAILASGLMERFRQPPLMALGLVVASSLAACLSMYLVPRVALVYLNLIPFLERPGLAWLPPAAAGGALMLTAALLIGGALVPWTLILADGGRALSRLVPALVLGGLAAQGVVALLLVPGPGLRRALALTAAIGLLPALLLIGAGRSGGAAMRQTLTLLLLGLMIVVGAFPATWDPRVIDAGFYRYGVRSLQRFGSADDYLRARRSLLPIYYREGREATVVVERSEQPALGQAAGEGLALTIDGRVEATTGQDLRTQVLQGHIPILAHGPTADVLLIDYLNGVAAGAVLRHPVTRLHVLEREGAVIQAGLEFGAFNGRPEADTRLTVVADTARARLLADPRVYDVIILTTSEPWLPHGAAAVTREGYGILKSRLREGGLVAQRVQAGAMPETAVRTLLRTFAGAFDHILVFAISPEDLLLLGSGTPLGLDVGWLRNVLGSQAAVQEDLRRALVPTANEILNLFRLDRDALLRFAGDGPIHDDDRGLVEAASVRRSHIHDSSTLMAALEAGRVPIVPWLRNYGATPREQGDFLYGLAKSYLGLAADIAGARAVADELQRLGIPVKARWVLGEIHLQEGSLDGAIEQWNGVLEIDPGNLDALFSLGTWYLDGRDFWRAEPLLAKAARLHPDTAAVRYHYGRTLYALGKNREAIAELREVERLAGSREQYPLVKYLVGLAAHKLKREAEAAEALKGYLEWAYTQALTAVELDAHLKLAEVYDALDRRLDAHKERQKGEDLRRRLAAAARTSAQTPSADSTPASPSAPGPATAPTPGPAPAPTPETGVPPAGS